MIDIQVDISKTLRALTELEEKQWPFAMAKTLTSLAKLGNQSVRKVTKQKFNLRSERFTLKGITIRPAKKADVKIGKGFSEVYTKPRVSQYMAHHEPGAQRTPIRSRTIAIPAKDLKKKQFRSAKGRVKKQNSPKNLIKQAGAFSAMYKFERGRGFPQTQSHNKRLKPFTIKTTSGATAIVRRKSRKTRKLEYLWIFKKMVTIDPGWGFNKTVKQTVDLMFERILKINLTKAIRSSR